MSETRESYIIGVQDIPRSWLIFEPHGTADAEELVINAAKAYADAYLAYQCEPTAETARSESKALDALLSATWQLQARENQDDVQSSVDFP